MLRSSQIRNTDGGLSEARVFVEKIESGFENQFVKFRPVRFNIIINPILRDLSRAVSKHVCGLKRKVFRHLFVSKRNIPEMAVNAFRPREMPKDCLPPFQIGLIENKCRRQSLPRRSL